MNDGNENRDIRENKKGYEEKKKAYLPTKLSLMIRLFVAAYLVYIVYSLKDVTEKYAGTELVFFIIAMIAFSIIAVFLIVHSLRALSAGKYVGGTMDVDNLNDDVTDIDDAEDTDKLR
ncbi:hypothetical protein EDD76_110103 [Kineothrix alysoides]|uniref:Uncharacterized protein n=1 Tax=Kineothrix alysoides TaxID=1469948 RepID=A0A4R1QY79_9FIRM|nr:hypothetical protein [Kineothrix alysoides]TCL56930.1 hypothetical protein EDD76_110103 [Kineothrix alysoides]